MSYLKIIFWVTAASLCLLFFCSFNVINEYWVIDPDSAAYVGLAQSIIAGDGYSFAGVPHTKYPPLFSMILALTGWLGGEDNYQLMQYVVALFWMISIGLIFLVFSQENHSDSPFKRTGVPKTRATGLILSLLFASSIYMLQYSTVFLRTEMVFTAFGLGTIWAGIKLQQSKSPSFIHLVVFALLFQCAYLTRMAGIALVGAMVIVLVFDQQSWARREKKWLLAGLLILICVMGPGFWVLRNNAVKTPSSTDYSSEFTQKYGLDLTKNRDLQMDTISIPGMGKRIYQNTRVFFESCAKMLLNSNKGGAKFLIALGIGALCAFGLFYCLVRRRSFVDYFCLLYLGLYLIWPFNQQQRFYMPLLPFLMEYAAISLLFLNRLLPLILRHKGAWYLFFAGQAPLMALAFCARSNQPDFFGLYSKSYLVFLLALTLSLLSLDIYLLYEKAKPGGLKWMIRSLRLGLPLLYVCYFLSLGFHDLLVTHPENHKRFLKLQKEQPPPLGFEKIEAHPEFIKLASWIARNTEPDAVIMCDIPKMLHILTGRRTVPFTFSSKKGVLAEEVNGLKPSFVYYSGEIDWVYDIFVRACKNHKKVYSCRIDVGQGVILEPALYQIL